MELIDAMLRWGDFASAVRENHDLSHFGQMEQRNGNEFFWGLRHPDTTLLVGRKHPEDGIVFERCDREQWEVITFFHPPFPWNEDGTAIVYPDPSEKQWWEA